MAGLGAVFGREPLSPTGDFIRPFFLGALKQMRKQTLLRKYTLIPTNVICFSKIVFYCSSGNFGSAETEKEERL